MRNFKNEHTFVVCAYKESPFLEKCLESLKSQTIESTILMTTSTPCDYIENIAGKYNIPLLVNEDGGGITQDWNFAYQQCKTPYVTIAHQDDIYYPLYAERAVKFFKKSEHPLIYFCDYCEIRNEKKDNDNRMLKIKKFMLSPFKVNKFQKNIFVRRRILSLGCPIACPSVSFAKEFLPPRIFRVHFRSCCDWEAWETISKIRGEFLYDPTILMGHRIHRDSETSLIIGENARIKEDFEMLCKFWPAWIAKIIVYFYSKSEKSNTID